MSTLLFLVIRAFAFALVIGGSFEPAGNFLAKKRSRQKMTDREQRFACFVRPIIKAANHGHSGTVVNSLNQSQLLDYFENRVY